MSKPDRFRDARDLAFKRGDLFYEGTPCFSCKGTKRYACNSCCAHCAKEHNRKSRGLYESKRGAAVYDKQHAPRPLSPWPESHFEDAQPSYNDTIGSYKSVPNTALRYASSAADTAEG